jgi:Bifunctional DNA primase/polymerase, N-terminal/Protein of unknown function (DUF3987)
MDIITQLTTIGNSVWKIFPLRAGTKDGQLVPSWPADASNDPGQISRWAQRFPNCNWGLATGNASGVFVLDVDSDEAGRALQKLNGFWLPDTRTIQTAKGWHFYFNMPDMAIGNSSKGLPDGVHVRGTGGYVVLPPSFHPDGPQYAVIDPSKPITEAPEWLLQLVVTSEEPSQPQTAPRPATAEEIAFAGNILRKGCADLAATKEGGRNNALNRLAFTIAGLIASGCLPAESSWNEVGQAALRSGLPGQEIKDTLASAVNGMQKPYAPAILQLPANLAEIVKNNQGFMIENVGFRPPSLPTIGRVWPTPMNDAAFHGPVGEFIRLVADSTEADVNALVVVFITAMGCWFGRKPFFMIEDTRHGTNLFSTMVGGTSSGRKGTTTDRVKAILKAVDLKFCRERIHNTGLGTGEGLVDKVRDPREDSMVHPDKQHGAKAKRTLVDVGVDDKRLLAIESEFAAVLQKGKREGNTLTQIMRVAWDAFRIGGGAKTNKDVCQEPHISMIGNITEPELRRCLTQNDMSNGFANRILWCCTKRSKSLPFSKKTDEQRLRKLAAILTMVGANLPDEMYWTQESASLWQQVYPQLTSGKGGGLFEDITARAAPQVIRIMMIYACLDQSSTFKVEHLRASLEVWRYCEDSARYIFGDAIGDANANKILAKLAASPQGVSESDISNLFGRNIPASELHRALTVLEQSGQAMRSLIPTAGRPTTIWRIQA